MTVSVLSDFFKINLSEASVQYKFPDSYRNSALARSKELLVMMPVLNETFRRLLLLLLVVHKFPDLSMAVRKGETFIDVA